MKGPSSHHKQPSAYFLNIMMNTKSSFAITTQVDVFVPLKMSSLWNMSPFTSFAQILILHKFCIFYNFWPHSFHPPLPRSMSIDQSLYPLPHPFLITSYLRFLFLHPRVILLQNPKHWDVLVGFPYRLIDIASLRFISLDYASIPTSFSQASKVPC